MNYNESQDSQSSQSFLFLGSQTSSCTGGGDDGGQQTAGSERRSGGASLRYGDEVMVVECYSGQAKRFSGRTGVIVAHKSGSPWYLSLIHI